MIVKQFEFFFYFGPLSEKHGVVQNECLAELRALEVMQILDEQQEGDGAFRAVGRWGEISTNNL